MGNYIRNLVYVFKLGDVVKTRKSRSCCSYFSLKDIEKREVFWLGSSYAIDKVLKGQIDARNFSIAYIALELVDGVGKALDFY